MAERAAPRHRAADDAAFVAYALYDGGELVPAPASRRWMDETRGRFAYRCLPLLIANQAGWLIPVAASARAVWDGGPGPESVTIECRAGGAELRPTSHFGEGIVTWTLPFLFRTPPGYDLLVRGPANWPKDGACALEGIVETDWTAATFTMNWKLTRPGLWVEFAEGEPLCMVVPQRRGDLERLRPEYRPLARDRELAGRHEQWAASRAAFLAELATPGSEAARDGWQRDYFRGTSPDGDRFAGHRLKLRLRSFDRRG